MRRVAAPTVMVAAAFAVLVSACGGGTSLEPATTTSTTAATTAPTSTVATTTTTTLPPTTTTTTEPGPVLENRTLAEEGDKNGTVETFQFLINCNNIDDLTVDGSFGPATRAAIKAAQTSLGQTSDGSADEDLLRELSRTCSQRRRLTGGGEQTVLGNTAPGDPEVYEVGLLGGSSLAAIVVEGDLITVALLTSNGTEIPLLEDGSWDVEESGDYALTVVTDGDEPETFILTVTPATGADGGGWILATNGISYGDTKLSLGDGFDAVIDEVYDYLGHGVRGRYAEFDTEWSDDPGNIGLRGVFIEGLAFLFYGPSTDYPGQSERLARIRFEGSGHDADGDPRPSNYVTTAEGVTVGHTLAFLKAAYGSGVKAGSNANEHFYRYTDSGGEMCFYFGANAPTDGSVIAEIATQCRD